MLLEDNIVTFVKNELKKIQKVLSPENLESQKEEEEVLENEDEEQKRNSREAFVKITLNFLRKMKQEALAEHLQSMLLPFDCQHKLKSGLKKKFQSVFEGIAKAGSPTLLNQIYTELYITEGGTGEVNDEHEVRQIETASRKLHRPETTIRQEDIFKVPPQIDQPIRTVMTKGVAGIGKTVLTQKFTLDWAEHKAHQNIQFIFPFTFRELNVLKEKKFSLVELIHHFFTETKGICSFEHFQVLFIFDGLDESRLPLDFHNKEILTDVTESTSVDVLLTNLIRGNLLPSALLWITTRPAAASQIPPQCVGMVTEVRGFTDPQKEEYFRRRFSDKEQASRIISHLKTSRSLHIMCHIPVFCWITASVLEDMLETNKRAVLPRTLTEMYIHFLVVQTKVKKVKYDGGAETDPHWSLESRKMIESLGKLAFDQLQKGNLIFYELDLTECGIDIRAASVYSGVFTQIFREERGLYQDKVFCFVHLSVQEFLAALYVHLTFINSSVNLISGSQATKKPTVVKHPKLIQLHQAAVNKALQSPNGHLDLFIRFLLGLSLQTNHTLLRGLISQTESTTSQETAQYIRKRIGENLSVEKSINLFFCLNELNHQSLVEEIQKTLSSGSHFKEKLSPAHWSALVFILLSSEKDLDVFDLKKYSASEDTLLRLLPLVKVSKKAILSGCDLSDRSCEALSSVISNHWSSLQELDLSNNKLMDSGVNMLWSGLESQHLQLESLRLVFCSLTEKSCEGLASVLRSQSSNLRELDLSNNDLQDSGVTLLSGGLKSPHCKLEILRLSGCLIAEEGSVSLASALSSNPSYVRELDLSYNNPGLKAVKLLTESLEDPHYGLETLRVEPVGVRWLQKDLRKYSCQLTIDINTVGRRLKLSDNNRKVTRVEAFQSYPDHPDRFDCNQLLCRNHLTGRSYWEVEWDGNVRISMSYRGIRKKGCSEDSLFGFNNQSWSLSCSDRDGYTAWHDKKVTPISSSSVSNRVAVYLDSPAGTLSFYRVSSDSLIHLHTFSQTFTEALHPGFILCSNSSVFLCNIVGDRFCAPEMDGFRRKVGSEPEPSCVSLKSHESTGRLIDFKSNQPSTTKREDQQSSEVSSGPSAQQHQTHLNILKELERNVFTFVTNELKTIQKVLSPDYKETLESQSEGESEKQRNSRDAFQKITVNILRNMGQERLADRLQSRSPVMCMHNLKSNLKQKFECVFEGIAKAGNPALLNQIYTELYITEGGTGEVNNEHEVRQIETASRKPHRPETTIKLEDIFKVLPGRDQPIRTVMTKGAAGIGKTVLTQKFTLDWAEHKAHQNIQFIFPFTFRELNVLKEKKFSLVELIHHFFTETKGICSFEHFQVLFIIDSLDESRLPLDFHNQEILTDVTESTSVDVLLTNLIRGNLLPSARLWITTRPAAASQIPPQCVGMVTEVRGFTDPQKEQYFKKKFKDKKEASRIISHIKASRSLHIMCHIPVFCWITASVLEDMLENTEGGELPKTLTEMYIHFLVVQTKVKKVKYDRGAETDQHWSPESRKMIESLGKLAFDQLQKGNLIFYESDLTECGIDIRAASVYSGVFTQIFKEERGLYQDKVFCFVHLSVQEFLAALHVHLTFIKDGTNLMAKQQRKPVSPMALTKPDPICLYQGAVDRAIESPNGHLDLFLRFLLGLSLQTNQSLLRGLLTQTGSSSQTTQETTQYIKKKISENQSVEKSINLFHCLNELNDRSLVEEIQQSLNSGRLSTDELSPAQWSALVFILLSSERDKDEFHLKKYCLKEEALERLLPVVKTTPKALMGACNLSERNCSALSKVLSSQSSSLRELDLSNNNLTDLGVEQLCDGLRSPECMLKILSLSGCLITEKGCVALASALSSNPSHLKELDLSYNNPGDAGKKVLLAAKENPQYKLQTIKLEPAGVQWLKPGLTKYSCWLTIDTNTVSRKLKLSEDNRTVTRVEELQSYPDHPDRFDVRPQLLCREGLTGRCYWEVNIGKGVDISVSYKGIVRKGDTSDCQFGMNNHSWSLICSDRHGNCLWYNKTGTSISSTSVSNRVAIYVDCPAGVLSFYRVSSDSLIHLHTFNTTFTEPLYPGFAIFADSFVSLL
ncbi:uncharacterized protein FYW61_021835 [Anableps anableps]